LGPLLLERPNSALVFGIRESWHNVLYCVVGEELNGFVSLCSPEVLSTTHSTRGLEYPLPRTEQLELWIYPVLSREIGGSVL
jgi:hypothetical protein